MALRVAVVAVRTGVAVASDVGVAVAFTVWVGLGAVERALWSLPPMTLGHLRMPSTDLFERDWYPNHEGACAAQVLRFGSVAEAEVCPSARLRRVRAVGSSHAAELRHFYRDPVYAPSTRMRKSMPPALVELRQPTSQRPFMHSV